VRLDVKPGDVQWGAPITADSSTAPSTVYRCVASTLQEWAVKVPKVRTGEDLDRFHMELGVMAQLNGHPHVTELAAGLAFPPKYALAMPYYSGGSLGALLHHRGVALPFADVLRCLIGLCRGLAALHALGHVHRDVKPDNALLDVGPTAIGPGPHVRLADLGLAIKHSTVEDKAVDYKGRSNAPSGGFHKKHLVGTLRYLAPEVLSKAARHSPASDVYALGVTACELVSGVVPFADCTKDPELHTVIEMGYGEQALQAAVCADGLRPTLPGTTDRSFAELVERMWDADPEARPEVLEVLECLERMAEPYRQTPPHPAVAVTSTTASSAPAHDGFDSPPPTGGYSRALQPPAGRLDTRPAWLEEEAPAGEGGGMTRLWSGLFASQGPRDTQEDRHVVCEDLGGVKGLHLMAVFDGHRGSECAALAAQELPSAVLQALASGAPEATPEACLEEAFATLERRFAEAARLPPHHRHPCPAGATAVVAMVLPTGGLAPGFGTLVVAHAGDSALLLFGPSSSVLLTPPHTASDPAERAAVLGRGGTVVEGTGGPRVDGRIQVTRGLGDLDLKPSLSAVPSTTRVPLGPDHVFLVLCSDGVTDVLTPSDIAAMAAATVPQPAMLARRLVDEAVNTRNSQDNATAIVAFLQPMVSHKRVR